MSVYKQKDSDKWSYRFNWNGKHIRESTKQTNKRVAEQMEAARKTQLAKNEVGIRDVARVPTLGDFAQDIFLPYVRTHNEAKPATVTFYENSARHLRSSKTLASLPLDQIKGPAITNYIQHRQSQKPRPQVSTINRELATLKRVFKLAMEWGTVTTVLAKVTLLSGENVRERVLTDAEETAYLKAATELGERLQRAHEAAKTGIRATLRGEIPIQPDAFLLRDLFIVLIDMGLRPEEAYRLTWSESIRDENYIFIAKGKGRGSRRRVPVTDRVRAVLAWRKLTATSDYVFPASTKSGHIEVSTAKKQHATACQLAGIEHFVIYILRHTCLTRLAPHMSTFALQQFAGHTDSKTTSRYVHSDGEEALKAMVEVRGRHSFGHSAKNTGLEAPAVLSVIN